LIADATTANPRPDSPALAASMEAFNDNRLISSAISIISLEKSNICIALLFSFKDCSN
jgi:hypothetical protein